MGHERALLARWSRRDRLAVLVVAVTIAFLTGSSILFVSMTAQTTAIAEEFDTQGSVEYYDSVEAARQSAAANAVVIPAASVTQSDGTTAYVLAVSNADATAIRSHTAVSLPTPPPSGVVRGGVSTPRTRTVTGQEATVTVRVSPPSHSTTILPSDWYVGTTGLVERLGVSGAFVITPETGESTPTQVLSVGALLRSALAFFVVGTRQFLALFGLFTVGAGLLIGVTTYSVTRMTVHDRVRTIRVIRATGGTPAHVRRLFALRAFGLVAVGTALGYAVGVILPNVAVNVAVFLGMPTSLSLAVTPDAVKLLGPAYGTIGLLGLVTGYLATWSTTRCPPAHLEGKGSNHRSVGGDDSALASRVPVSSPLSLLDWRPLVPTTATLTIFIAFLVLLATAIGVVGPAIAGSGTTITESGAAHPIASDIPAGYATALRAKGVPASGEILLFTVTDGQPFLVRGAVFEHFATVSNATLTAGRPPRTTHEAVIGEDLAETLDVHRGESLVIGGSTRAGFTRVTVVGRYAAPGPFDDQLIVPLATARELARVGPGQVQFIRTATTLASERTLARAEVVAVTTPERIIANRSTSVTFTLVNTGSESRETTVPIRLGPISKTKRVSLAPSTRRTVQVTVDAPRPGSYTLRVGTVTRSVTVVDPHALTVRGLPTRMPPDSAPQFRVLTATGHPVTNATIAVDGRRVHTGPNGTARVHFDQTGTYTLRVHHERRELTRTVHVTPAARRGPQVTLRPRPKHPSLLTAVDVVATVRNPWHSRQTWSLTLGGPGETRTRTVALAPGGQTRIAYSIGHLAPGTYTLQLATANQTVATKTIRVAGNERLVTAIATQSHRSAGSTFGRAVTVLFGNLNIVVSVVIGLAGLMTIGSITAAFARAIYARRRTLGIYRATGAGPGRIVRMILSDAVVVGGVATGLALCLAAVSMRLLSASDLLTFFGIRFTPMLTPGLVLLSALGAFTVVLVGAGLATVAILRAAPSALIAE